MGGGGVLILLNVCPDTPICVLILLCMCPHTSIYVSLCSYIVVVRGSSEASVKPAHRRDASLY